MGQSVPSVLVVFQCRHLPTGRWNEIPSSFQRPLNSHQMVTAFDHYQPVLNLNWQPIVKALYSMHTCGTVRLFCWMACSLAEPELKEGQRWLLATYPLLQSPKADRDPVISSRSLRVLGFICQVGGGSGAMAQSRLCHLSNIQKFFPFQGAPRGPI